jgi:hypothetical protein
MTLLYRSLIAFVSVRASQKRSELGAAETDYQQLGHVSLFAVEPLGVRSPVRRVL